MFKKILVQNKNLSKLLNFYDYLVKLRLQGQYKNVAERIISMALDSVDYSEEKACQILNIVQQEDNDQKKLEQKSEITVPATTSEGNVASDKNDQRYVRCYLVVEVN